MSLLLGVLLPALALAAAWVWRCRCVGFNCRKIKHRVEVLRKGAARRTLARVHPHIDAAALRQAEAWRPWLMAHGQQDAEWDWRGILQDAEIEALLLGGAFEGYALVLDGKVLALLFLCTRGWTSRNPGDPKPLVYVERIAVAPECRHRPPDRLFAGCGEGLLRFAMHRSRSLGMDGRIGLHSLPDAEGFYRRLRLIDYGPDAGEQGWRYFESPPSDV